MSTERYFKWVGPNGESLWAQGSWTLPEGGQPAAWMPELDRDQLQPCVYGYHAWPPELVLSLTPLRDDAILIEVELGGVLVHERKRVSHRARCLRLTGWTWEAYDQAMAPAREAFNQTMAPAQEAYDQAMAPAREAYDQAMASAQEAYDQATASAREAYDQAMAPAREAYNQAVASAREAYDQAMAPAREAYNQAVASLTLSDPPAHDA